MFIQLVEARYITSFMFSMVEGRMILKKCEGDWLVLGRDVLALGSTRKKLNKV